MGCQNKLSQKTPGYEKDMAIFGLKTSRLSWGMNAHHFVNKSSVE